MQALIGLLLAAGPALAGSTASAQAANAAANATAANDTADVHFMQGMIMHHAQALQMVSLIADHTTRPETAAAGPADRHLPAGRDPDDADLASGPS